MYVNMYRSNNNIELKRGGVHNSENSFSKGVPHQGVGYTLLKKRCTPPRGGVHTSEKNVYPTRGWGTHV